MLNYRREETVYEASSTPLTARGIGSRLFCMTSRRPTFFGLSSSAMASRAKEAVENAVASDAKAGISVTGWVDGRVQTLAPTDPRILAVIERQEERTAKASNARRG